jgi:hypothetical protein
MERKLSTPRQDCQVDFTCLEIRCRRIRNALPPSQVRGTEAVIGERQFRVMFAHWTVDSGNATAITANGSAIRGLPANTSHAHQVNAGPEAVLRTPPPKFDGVGSRVAGTPPQFDRRSACPSRFRRSVGNCYRYARRGIRSDERLRRKLNEMKLSLRRSWFARAATKAIPRAPPAMYLIGLGIRRLRGDAAAASAIGIDPLRSTVVPTMGEAGSAHGPRRRA